MSWRERENNNKNRGHCVSLLQCTACTATLGPIKRGLTYGCEHYPKDSMDKTKVSRAIPRVRLPQGP